MAADLAERRRRRYPSLPGAPVVFYVCSSVGIVLAAVSIILAIRIGTWYSVLLDVLLISSLLLGVHQARRFWRRESDQNEGRCPVCHYNLLDLPPAVPRGNLGHRLGPRRCPECGEPWPRVPDPAPPRR